MKKMSTKKLDNKGVSPVIGVILMVAATIVIAGVVMAMLGGFKAPTPAKTVGVSVSRINSTAVDFTIMSIEPAGTTIDLISVTGATGAMGTSVGNVSTLTTTGTPPVHIVLTATFADNTQQVIYDSRV